MYLNPEPTLHRVLGGAKKCSYIKILLGLFVEDLIENLFFELYKRVGRYDGQGYAEAYPFGIARNLISHYHRNKGEYPQTNQTETIKDLAVSNSSQQSQPISIRQLRKLLKNATEQLLPKAKEAIRTRLIEVLSPKEAAPKIRLFHRCTLQTLRSSVKNLWRRWEKQGISKLITWPIYKKN